MKDKNIIYLSANRGENAVLHLHGIISAPFLQKSFEMIEEESSDKKIRANAVDAYTILTDGKTLDKISLDERDCVRKSMANNGSLNTDLQLEERLCTLSSSALTLTSQEIDLLQDDTNNSNFFTMLKRLIETGILQLYFSGTQLTLVMNRSLKWIWYEMR